MNRKELIEHFGGLIDDEALDALEGEKTVEVFEAENLSDDLVGKSINVRGKVTKVNGRRKAGEHDVATAFIGPLKLSFWDDAVDMAERIREGYSIVILNGLLRKKDDAPELIVNGWSEMDVLSEESQSYFFPLDKLPLKERVNVEGIALEKPSIRSFLKNNNEIGVVGSMVLSDGTNSVRVVVWNSAVKALKNIDVYDRLQIYDCRVKRNGMIELHCDSISRIVPQTQQEKK